MISLSVEKERFQFISDPDGINGTPEEERKIEALAARSLKYYFAQKRAVLPLRFRLGAYRVSDPFLIVMSESDAQLYMLDFPPPLDIVTDNTVVNVYNGAIYLGPDVTSAERARSRARALARAREDSKLLP